VPFLLPEGNMINPVGFFLVVNLYFREYQWIFNGDFIAMSMKKWTDEELITTRDNLEAWSRRNNSSGTKLWLFTAFLGAFAISTGFAFIFLDGFDVLSIILIIMGTITCISWYKSDKQRKDNMGFLAEINKEIKSRKMKAAPEAKDKTVRTDTNGDEQKDSVSTGLQTTEKSDKKTEERPGD
jgi:hypothetical protein